MARILVVEESPEVHGRGRLAVELGPTQDGAGAAVTISVRLRPS